MGKFIYLAVVLVLVVATVVDTRQDVYDYSMIQAKEDILSCYLRGMQYMKYLNLITSIPYEQKSEAMKWSDDPSETEQLLSKVVHLLENLAE